MSRKPMVIETSGQRPSRKDQRKLRESAMAAGLALTRDEDDGEVSMSFPRVESRGPGQGYVAGADVKRPAMRASSERAQALIPFLADVGSGFNGPRIGIEKTGGGWFHFDPWEFYRKGWITGTGVVQVGGVGAGKSTTAKCALRRSLSWGRHVALASDPKGEHTRVAQTVPGAQILSLGDPSQRINVLDAGVRPAGVSDRWWAGEIHARRQQIVRTIVSIMRDGKPIVDEEHTALDHALTALEASPAVATIRGLVDRLFNPDEHEEKDVKTAGRHLGHGLQRAITGDLSGMFDEESTVNFDTSAPMLVMDTRVVTNKPVMTKAVATACTSFWIDSVVRDKSSGYWYVVNEEGWSEMSDPRSVDLMNERQRLAGEYGLATWLILHEIQDLEQVGPEGSDVRAKALGLLSKAQIKIIHRQSEESIDATARALKLTDREAEKAVNLAQGEALWKIGKRHLIVKTLITRKEWEVYNTEENRGGL